MALNSSLERIYLKRPCDIKNLVTQQSINAWPTGLIVMYITWNVNWNAWEENVHSNPYGFSIVACFGGSGPVWSEVGRLTIFFLLGNGPWLHTAVIGWASDWQPKTNILTKWRDHHYMLIQRSRAQVQPVIFSLFNPDIFSCGLHKHKQEIKNDLSSAPNTLDGRGNSKLSQASAQCKIVWLATYCATVLC